MFKDVVKIGDKIIFIVYYISNKNKLLNRRKKGGEQLVPKITNRDRFGNILDVEQMLKRFKKDVVKAGTLEGGKKT